MSFATGELVSKPMRCGADARQRLSFKCTGKAHAGKPGPEPDSGKPTVRDHRGAWGNVAYGGIVNPPCNRKGRDGNPPPKGARASDLSRQFAPAKHAPDADPETRHAQCAGADR